MNEFLLTTVYPPIAEPEHFRAKWIPLRGKKTRQNTKWGFFGMYEWIKALHVIAVISWMAGMLYLPRLFVYHCEAEVGSKQSETFKVMERRLLRAIINPAMIVTWLAGLYLAWSGHWFALTLVARKTGTGPGDVGGPRLFFALAEGFRCRPAPAESEILSNYQRGADRPNDLDRHHGDREAVLGSVRDRSLSASACGVKSDFLYWRYPTQRRRMWSCPSFPEAGRRIGFEASPALTLPDLRTLPSRVRISEPPRTPPKVTPQDHPNAGN
ncbi:hypothetical protein ACVWXO_002471 [Bradyrhizobium sp. LM2.7]